MTIHAEMVNHLSQIQERQHIPSLNWPFLLFCEQSITVKILQQDILLAYVFASVMSCWSTLLYKSMWQKYELLMNTLPETGIHF